MRNTAIIIQWKERKITEKKKLQLVPWKRGGKLWNLVNTTPLNSGPIYYILLPIAGTLGLKEILRIRHIHIAFFFFSCNTCMRSTSKTQVAYSTEWLWGSLNAACGPTTVVRWVAQSELFVVVVLFFGFFLCCFAGVDYDSSIKGMSDHWSQSFSVKPDAL